MNHLIKPQLVKDIDYKRVTYPMYAQRKWNGVRALLWVHPDGRKYFQSRALKPIISCQHILDIDFHLYEFPYIIDGEIVVDSEKDDFNKSSGLARRHYNSPELVFKAFDFLQMSPTNSVYNAIYQHRLYALTPGFLYPTTAKAIHKVKTYTISNETELNEMIDRALAEEWEGIVLKKPSSLYSIGKRNYDWQRIIFRQNDIGRVIAVLEGEGKCSGTMGTLICECKGKRFGVGTGFDDQARRNIWENRESFKTKRFNFSYKVESPTSFIQPAFISWV